MGSVASGLPINESLSLKDLSLGSQGVDRLAVAPFIAKYLRIFFGSIDVHYMGDRADNTGNAYRCLHSQ